MPPRRRAAGASQSTLSFGTQSRITKPTSTPTTLHKAKKADSPAVVPSDQSEWGTPEPQQLLADAEPSKPHVAELVVRQQAAVARQEVPSSAEEQRALRMSQKDIQSYWEQQEKSRKAPRIHQQDLDLEEKILRHFDLSSQYGPCIGIARHKRWRRANTLNLHPPLEVLAVLLKEQNVNERAHVDELLS